MILAAILLALSDGHRTIGWKPDPAPRCIVFIADDVGYWDVGDSAVTGQPLPLPNLDYLRAQGVEFTHCTANPVCTPSRRSLLTGAWTTTGASCEEQGLRPPSLADVWDGPSGVFGKWHMGGTCGPLAWGFERWGAGGCTSISYPRLPPWPTTWTRYDQCVTSEDPSYPPTTIAATALDWWADDSLIVIGMPLAHQEFHMPLPRPIGDLPDGTPALLPPGWPPAAPLPSTAFQRRRWQFESMIVAMDTCLGLLLDHVDLSKTYVVFVGDNGTPPLATPGGIKAKGTTFERGIRVPLVIAGPGAVPGTSDMLVHAVDVFSTLAAIGGEGASFDGFSLLPTVLGQYQPPVRTYVLSGYNADVCARSAGYKLRVLNGVESFYELSDADEDGIPDETYDAINEPEAQALIEAHREWLNAQSP